MFRSGCFCQAPTFARVRSYLFISNVGSHIVSGAHTAIASSDGQSYALEILASQVRQAIDAAGTPGGSATAGDRRGG